MELIKNNLNHLNCRFLLAVSLKVIASSFLHLILKLEQKNSDETCVRQKLKETFASQCNDCESK